MTKLKNTSSAQLWVTISRDVYTMSNAARRCVTSNLPRRLAVAVAGWFIFVPDLGTRRTRSPALLSGPLRRRNGDRRSETPNLYTRAHPPRTPRRFRKHRRTKRDLGHLLTGSHIQLHLRFLTAEDPPPSLPHPPRSSIRLD